MVEQINVFLENKPGRLKKITGLLKEQGINIRGVVIQDRGDFGMMKLLVNDPVKAQYALSGAGLAAAFKPIVAVLTDDRPGGLYAMSDLLDQKGINILDAYGFVIESGKRAVFCVEVKEPEAVETILAGAGYKLLSGEELYNL